MFRVRSRKLPASWGRVLGFVPFLVLVLIYASVSHKRLAENPRDKLTPGRKAFAKGWDEVTKARVSGYVDYAVKAGDTLESIAAKVSGNKSFAGDIRDADGKKLTTATVQPGLNVRVPETESYLWKDLKASLKRLFWGMLIGVAISLTLGLGMGVFTPVEKTFYSFVAALSKIPPLAILPIIFIFQGIGESAKITIIALGIAPLMTMDILLRVKDIATELITKAYTLGASTLEVTFKVVLPQVWPGFLNSVRLSFGPAWVFLIASEAIAANAGLGYRIFVVQRQLGMNVILIYVGIIMLIGLGVDWLMRWFIHSRYKWAEQK